MAMTLRMSELCEAVLPHVQPHFSDAEAGEYRMLDAAGEWELAFELQSLVKVEHDVALPVALQAEIRAYLEDWDRFADLRTDDCYPEISYVSPFAAVTG